MNLGFYTLKTDNFFRKKKAKPLPASPNFFKLFLSEFYNINAAVVLRLGRCLCNVHCSASFASGDYLYALRTDAESRHIVCNRLRALVGKQHVVLFRSVPVGVAYENNFKVRV